MAGSGDTSEAGSAKPKRSLMSVILEFAVVTLIAAAAGAGMAMLQGAPAAAPALPKKDEAAETPHLTLLDLPPIVTNLASPADLWIRLEASIVVEGKSFTPSEVLVAEIASDVLAYLRTLTVAQIEGPIGLQNIRQDLNDRAAVRSKGKVVELVLKTLVVQ